MTEFTRVSKEVEDLKDVCEKLMNAPTEDAILHVNDFESLHESMEKILPVFQRYRKNITEKDPEKMLYGPKMLEKITNLIDKFDTLYEVYEDELIPMYEPILTRKLQEAKKAEVEAIAKVNEDRHKAFQIGREETAEEEKRRKFKLRENEMEQEKIAVEIQERESRRIQMKRERAKVIEALQKEEEEIAQEGWDVSLFNAITFMLDHSNVVASNIVNITNSTTAGVGSPAVKGANDDFASNGFNNNNIYISKNYDNILMAFRKSIDAVLDVITQIASNPEVLSMRVIRLQNPIFQSNVGSKPGAVSLLRASGFTIKTASDISTVLNKLNLNASDRDEIYLYMEEPNIAFNYTEWSEWRSKVTKTRDILLSLNNAVSNLALTRTSLTTRDSADNVEAVKRIIHDFSQLYNTSK